MKLAALCLAALLAGCAHSPELIVLVGPKQVENDNQDFGAALILIQRFGEHGACGYVHGSDPAHGKPFNDHTEMQFDLEGCGFRFGGERR